MKVTINGTAHDITEDAIEYEALVELAGMSGTPSCTWKWGGTRGILSPGDGVFVNDGMVVNIVHTGNA